MINIAIMSNKIKMRLKTEKENVAFFPVLRYNEIQ